MDQEAQLSFLLEKKLQMLVEIATKRYDREILELRAQVSHLNQELETLRSNIKNIRIEQAQKPAPAVQHAHQHLPQEAPLTKQVEHISDQQVANAAASGESVSLRMAKSGNYSSEDVSVEKFFYYGNKR